MGQNNTGNPYITPPPNGGMDNSQDSYQSPEMDQATKAKMLASILKNGSQSTLGGQTQYVNGWAVPQSPIAGISSMLGSLATPGPGQTTSPLELGFNNLLFSGGL